MDQRYILILGLQHGAIRILDTKSMEIRKSLIQGPSCSFKAILIGNTKRRHLVTYGYSRRIWNEYKMGMGRFPPQYLMKLIEGRFSFEELHLFTRNYSRRCFRVDLDDILR